MNLSIEALLTKPFDAPHSAIRRNCIKQSSTVKVPNPSRFMICRMVCYHHAWSLPPVELRSLCCSCPPLVEHDCAQHFGSSRAQVICISSQYLLWVDAHVRKAFAVL